MRQINSLCCVIVQYIACSFVDSYVCKYFAIYTGPVSCDLHCDHVLS